MSKACRIDEIAVWDPNGSKGIKRSATFPDLVPGSKIPREVGLSQGVLDVIPKTNFPDIRKACFVHSAESGNMLMIPREERLVRFYVPLQDATSESQSKFIKQNYSAEYILDAARKILSPFKLEYNYCDWWSAYQIGQRVADCYSLYNRVFLAGDAVPWIEEKARPENLRPTQNRVVTEHFADTHSPKVGQGMNISIQDTYNLGWKLVECLQWKAHRSLLSTYESERRPVAQDLINFDQTYSKLWGTSLDAKASQVTEERITPLQAMFQRHVEFTTGLTTRYASNLIVWDQAPNDSMTPRNSTVQLAKNLVVGMRMPDFQVVNQSDAVPCQIHGLLKFDGHFRILVFAGDVAHAEGASRLRVFSDRWSALASSTSRMSSQDALLDSHIEVITIHAADRAKVEFQDFPDILHPWHEDRGWDYWKIYADGRDIFGNHGEAYTTCGINTACGCIVVVRPDGYIALIGSLEDVERINSFFAGLTKAPA
ncbi:MAG: hypothetical protein M1833_004308 [Piccolia ochrophora]|nr:MAG: hypothetical protein M1833_004308 [Piccolia ochrophora]